MDESEPLPIYTSDSGPLDLPTRWHDRDLTLLATRFPISNPDGRLRTEHEIANSFFAVVENKQPEVVAMLLKSKLVTPATVDQHGRTPLIAATAAGNVRMVQ